MADIWSEDEVLSLVNAMTNDPPFLERDAEYSSRRDLIFQRRPVVIPGVTTDAAGKYKEGMVQFRSPEIEDDGNDFKNRMLASPLKINAAALRKGQKTEEAAQRQENFFYRLYYRWRDQGMFDGVLFDMATMGIGWGRLSLNTDLLPIIPEWDGGDTEKFFEIASDELKKFTSGEKPDLFIFEHIDPATMYWSPDGSIKVQKALVPLNPLIQRYGKLGKQIYLDDTSGNISVTTLDPGQNFRAPRAYWARQVALYTVETSEFTYHCVFNNRFTSSNAQARVGAVLGAYRNVFKVPTFFSCIGEQTGDPHPLYKYRPLLQGKYQTVPVKNILTTAMMTSGAEAAQQRYSLKWIGQGVPDDDANQVVTVTEDGVVVPPPDYELVNSGLMAGPDLPGALKFIQEIDTYGYPKALNQPQEVTASSGYDRARQQDAVASLLDPPLSHFATMLTNVFKATLNAVVEMNVPITVRSTQTKPGSGRAITLQQETTLNPDDVADDTDISVSFNSTTIFSRIAMQEEGLKLMQADMMDESEFITDVRGVDDLQEWRDQRALDKVLKASEDRAVADVIATINKIADAAQQKAITDNNLPNPQQQQQPMVPTNAGALRNDRGPGIPVGPGQSMAVNPTPPAPAELGQPDVTNAMAAG